MFEPISQALKVPLVPYNEWLARLEASIPQDNSRAEVEKAAVTNPALRLMDMWRGFAKEDVDEARDAMAVVQLDTTLAVKVSPALQADRLKPLGERDALSWLTYWWRAGLLKTRVQ